ncbi:MAG: hypothetical protein IT243_09790 [Bacteroidia bacterium]|nr:hypothetical protein [Bacteroidia bacterium]
MKKLNQLFAIGLLICGLSFTASAQNSSKDGGSGDVTKMEKSRGADPNITVTSRKNGDGQESRVVDKNSRGGTGCKALFDNHTSYYIYCYVDGKLEGYVAPWGNGQVDVSNGTTSLYAVAEFNDGSKTTWGPISKSCNYQTFELEVYSSYYNWYVY